MFAPRMEDSKRGELIAESAALIARLSPDAWPKPIKAMPLPERRFLTSAKSRLTMPWIKIRSVTVFTDSAKTWLALEKALTNFSLPELIISLSFETTKSASTFSLRALIPSKALVFFFFPSKLNGRVTIPMTRQPASLAALATIGLAPVPVPPPSPTAMKIISAPLTIFLISS